MGLVCEQWCSPAHQIIGVPAIDHLDVMAPLPQLIGELLNKDSISAKTVGGIKSSDHAEAHWSDDATNCYCDVRVSEISSTDCHAL